MAVRPQASPQERTSSGGVAGGEAPFVSVIIPCRNAGEHIGRCLESVLGNDYPRDRLEVLVVDGMSDDGTSVVLEGYRHVDGVRIFSNPKKRQAPALNIGLAHARGEIIIRLDAHSACAHDHVSRVVKSLEEYNADAVGPILKVLPRRNTLIGRAIALVWQHPLGAGIQAYKRGCIKPIWVDSVPYHAVRREIFERLGFYNEEVGRSEDLEFNLRIKRAGGRLLLNPEIVCQYYTRSDFRSFWHHGFDNGFCLTYPVKDHRKVFLWKHLAPLALVTSAMVSAGVAMVFPDLSWLALAVPAPYALLVVSCSIVIASREGDGRYALVSPLVFAVLHVSYGVGSLYGLSKALLSRGFWRFGPVNGRGMK